MEGQDSDLLLAVDLSESGVSLGVLSVALSRHESEVLNDVERLVAAGVLSDEGGRIHKGSSFEAVPAGATRRARLAGRLADALAASGPSTEVGRLLLEAGRPADAYRLLTQKDVPDSFHRADLALRAYEQAGLHDPAGEGHLRLVRARHHRADGRSAEAAADLEVATHRIQGAEQIDALGFAAAVADDRQRPLEAERWVAMGELEAARQGDLAKLGSLLTFHGRILSRLGFPEEADATAGKGTSLVEAHGIAAQRFRARTNQAWIRWDRGEAAAAELAFARLREQALDLEGEASLADKEAYWARALFAIGRPQEAMDAVARARQHAARAGADAPVFISELALAEGGLLFHRYQMAAEAAERALELIADHLPAWENVGRYLLSRARHGLGDGEAARAELAAALAACPPGIDGWRWRQRCDAFRYLLEGALSQRQAEDLTDELLQARWYGAAVELLTWRSAKEADPALAIHAAALATQVGSPMAAAEALHAGGGWEDPTAPAVASQLRSVSHHVPSAWEEEWRALPHVTAALALPEGDVDEAVTALRAQLEETMAAAGLSGEVILSPAQRRAAGLVRRRPVRRRPLLLVAAAIGVVVVAVGASLAAVLLTREEPPPTTLAVTTTLTTAPPRIEDTVVAAPDNGLSGTGAYRGDETRAGVMAGGFRTLSGRYWVTPPGGFITTWPVAFGRFLYVGTSNDTIYAIDQTSGDVLEQMPVPSSITATPAVSKVAEGEAAGNPYLFVGTEAGDVYAFNAFRAGAPIWPPFPTGGRVEASPLIVGGIVYVAGSDGHVYAIDGQGGGSVWTYPTEGEPAAGRFRGSLAHAGGVVFAADDAGFFYALDASSGEPRCRPARLSGAVAVNPLVSGGTVFVGIEPGGVHAFPAGDCGAVAEGRAPFYPSSASVALAPAVDGDSMYLLEGRLLLSLDLRSEAWTNEDQLDNYRWQEPFAAETLISTPPTVADGVVYVGTQGGVVHAVDAESGEELWSFSIGSPVRGAPVAVPGAIYVAGADGNLWAIAGS